MYILTVVLTLEIRWTTNDFPKFEKRPQANQPYKWVFLQKLLLDKATMFRFLDPPPWCSFRALFQVTPARTVWAKV